MDEYEDRAPRPGVWVAILALTGASVVVAGGLTLAMEFGEAYPFVLLFTLAVAAAFAGSAFLVISRKPSWKKVVIAGFVTGAIFPAMALGAFVRELDQLLYVGAFGVAGVGGALIAWLMARWLLGGSIAATATIGLLVSVGLAGVWAVPWALMDRSCHNPLRDGRSSISPVAGFTFRASMGEWALIHSELERFAKEQGWDSRADVRPDPGFPWFQVSLCREPGSKFFISKDAFERDRISISIYQPQGGDSWQASMKELQEWLERRWPGRIGYDNYSPRPPWAPPAPQPSDARLLPPEKSL